MTGTKSMSGSQRVSVEQELRPEQLAAVTDPAALLDRGWMLEPFGRLDERRAVLERLAELIASGGLPDAPPGRDWQLELWAEQAIDAAAADRLGEAEKLAERVLRSTDDVASIAAARATLARGRALAWSGTEEGTRAGEALLIEAFERFGVLERVEWQGFTQFWRGHAICFENGRLREAEALMREALEILPYSSPRRSTILGFAADVMVDLGAWDGADAALDEAYRLAETADNAKARAYVAWTRAHTAAGRGDSVRAERLFREVERDATDWWQSYGGYFLCDAARTLDALCLTEQAQDYLARARTLLENSVIGSGHAPEDFEPLAAARALILARSGDPARALEELQGLAARRWLEKRLLWRFTLMGAWARLRAGNRPDAAAQATLAFAMAVELGGITVALAGEPDITLALAPLAAEAGSAPARELLSGGGEVAVRLFGTPEITTAEGLTLQLPAGKPSELVRMLALHDHGLPAEVVLEEFFPDTEPSTSRHRLRQVLTRLRSAGADIVLRDGEMLRLAPAWVDVREFRALAARARASRGTRALVFGHAAVALADRGPLLVTDPYVTWADDARAEAAEQLERLRDTLSR